MDFPNQNSENMDDPAIREILGQYELALEAEDFVAQGASLLHLGTLYAIRGQYTTAIEYYNQAIVIQRDIGDDHGLSKSLSNIGLAYADLGEYHKSIKYHLQALSISRQLGNRVAESNHLNNLAETYELLGHYDKAIAYLEQVQDLYRSMAVPHLMKKAQQHWKRLQDLQEQSPSILKNSHQPTIINKLQTERISSETPAIIDPENEASHHTDSSADKLQVVKNIMDKLPNPALEVVKGLMKAEDTAEMRGDRDKQQIINPRFEGMEEAESMTLFPSVEEEPRLFEDEAGEFGLDTEPVEAESTTLFPSVEEEPRLFEDEAGEFDLDTEPAEAESTTLFPSVDGTPDDSDNREKDPTRPSVLNEEDIREAIDNNKYELSIAEAIEALSKKGDYLMRLGTLHMKLHQYDNAIAYYEQAQVLFGTLGQTYFREEAERGILEARQQKWGN
jgi:tetratricopeptide (TPR) repeat protein